MGVAALKVGQGFESSHGEDDPTHALEYTHRQAYPKKKCNIVNLW